MRRIHDWQLSLGVTLNPRRFFRYINLVGSDGGRIIEGNFLFIQYHLSWDFAVLS